MALKPLPGAPIQRPQILRLGVQDVAKPGACQEVSAKFVWFFFHSPTLIVSNFSLLLAASLRVTRNPASVVNIAANDFKAFFVYYFFAKIVIKMFLYCMAREKLTVFKDNSRMKFVIIRFTESQTCPAFA